MTRLGAIARRHRRAASGCRPPRPRSDEIDHAVGVVCHAKRGASVAAGDVLAEVHARDEASGAEAVQAVLDAYELGDEPPREHAILLDVVA